MKIDEYITRHSLKPVLSSKEEGASNGEAIPKYAPPQLFPKDKNEKYEIYTNGDKTIWVSKNTSNSSFCIQKREKSGVPVFTSGWLDAKSDHKIH